MSDPLPNIKILGVRFDLAGIHQAAGIVCDWLKDGKKRYIATPNPEFVAAAQKDEEFRQILTNADLSITDGRGIQLAARFLGMPVPERIAGTDFMAELCKKFLELQKVLDSFTSEKNRLRNEINSQFTKISRPLSRYEYVSAMEKEQKNLLSQLIEDPFSVLLLKNKDSIIRYVMK